MAMMGDALADAGLAEEIKKGLAKADMKMHYDWADEATQAAKADELKKLGLGGILAMKDGAFVAGRFGANADNWDAFTGSNEFAALAKVQAYRDKIKKEKVMHDLFFEARPLGKGAFGAVYLVFKKDTGMAMATKKQIKTTAKKNHMIPDILIERHVLANINSPFCVSLHYSYQDNVSVFLTLTLCPGGDLAFLLKGRKKKGVFTPFEPAGLKFYIASMTCGLEAIHKAGFVYRDLKPMNVLLDAKGLVRISDMGLCADISKGAIKQTSGTRGYWSPETINKNQYTTEPDWWSLGVTSFVLFSDKMPFHGEDDAAKDAKTVSGEIDYAHGEPDDLKKFIGDLCTIDMSARLKGLSGVKAHPYFSGFNWAALESGELAPPVVPSPNDINAPDKNSIPPFVADPSVTWDADDQAKFATWDYMNTDIWGDEAIAMMEKRKLIGGGGGGGGGCCTIS